MIPLINVVSEKKLWIKLAVWYFLLQRTLFVVIVNELFSRWFRALHEFSSLEKKNQNSFGLFIICLVPASLAVSAKCLCVGWLKASTIYISDSNLIQVFDLSFTFNFSYSQWYHHLSSSRKKFFWIIKLKESLSSLNWHIFCFRKNFVPFSYQQKKEKKWKPPPNWQNFFSWFFLLFSSRLTLMGGGVCVCLCHDIWHDKMIFQMFRFYGISTFFSLHF